MQRAVIVLRAKSVEFDVDYINLRDKPDWFLKISPHGKVPVLSVDGQPLFESNAIAEYLDEQIEPRLHPADPLKRARNRAWTDFVPDFSAAVNLYYVPDKAALDAKLEAAPKTIGKLETALQTEREGPGPYFNDDKLSLVDAAYAPFLQRLAFVDARLKTGMLDAFPKVRAWSDTLLSTPLVTGSVPENFAEEFIANMQRRGSYAASFFESEAAD
ncbi:MAG: glutathione S-transferase family protein [Gammaproteobacteria bacterium]|nr:glutathione S-transferase family protein [Gammaproteobacteria bacterium]